MAEPIGERGNAASLHPTDTIVAKYRWTIEELKNALRSNFRHSTRPLFRAAFWVLAVFFCIGGALICVFESVREGAIIAGLGLLGPIAWAAAPSWLAWWQFRREPNQNAEIEWRFSADNIHIITPQSSTQAMWSAVFKVAQAPDGLFFYFTPQVNHWIPKHGFASEAEFDAAAELARKNCQNFIKLGGSILQGFRFQIKNLLWATFWLCVWAGALSHLMTFIEKHRPLNNVSWTMLVIAVWIPLLIVVWTPAIAIGALFNNMRRGALVGLIFVAVLIVLTVAVII